MRAISIKQPWAGLIASGRKSVELRGWATSYRGPLLVCAGARLDPRGHLYSAEGPTGHAIAVVELVDVRLAVEADAAAACYRPSDFAPECFAWILRDPRRIEPRPVKGQLGLFTPPQSIAV